MQQLKHNINKIADEIESESSLEMYWDYRDSLSEEQILKIITKEDGLNEVENDIWESYIDYISENVRDVIKQYCKENNIELSDEEFEELRDECEGRFKFDFNGLIKNSHANIRVQLNTNEDTIDMQQGIENETIRMFRKRFKGKFSLKDLKREVANCPGYSNFNFYFKVSGKDILEVRKQLQEGYLTLRKGLFFGLFDSFNGGGSILEMELLGEVKLYLKDWRIKDDKDAVVKRLDGENSKYYDVVIVGDSRKYGIQQVYGLSSWQEW